MTIEEAYACIASLCREPGDREKMAAALNVIAEAVEYHAARDEGLCAGVVEELVERLEKAS